METRSRSRVILVPLGVLLHPPSNHVTLNINALRNMHSTARKAMPVYEGTFLEPKDPSLTNSDLWPEFSLSKVKVTSQKDGQLVSLLSAHAGLPVKVSGQLEEVDDGLLSLGMFSGKIQGSSVLKAVSQ